MVSISNTIKKSNEIWKEWVYSMHEVEIQSTVLGRGAFGEVKLAKWRGATVAAKTLHVASDSEIAFETIGNEVELMSRLRHPNLLLFLGVCFDPRPVMLTELMPCSLYDVLESPQKVLMTLEEILEVSVDVVSGLEYLHGHSPVVIHRDISSKNILLGGGRAKIADLGQAKLFGDAALSRQSEMPGAMAYAAPEILTGKYTEKIDIFSLGVLMVQMCCGEYPRIDKREEHLLQAGARFSILNSFLPDMLKYQPSDRPTASEIRIKLLSIMENDRYYSPLRSFGQPQADIGILGYRWLMKEVEERNKDMKLALEQTGRRLNAEEQRFKTEANRLDEAKQTIVELEQCRINQQNDYRMLQNRAEKLESQLHEKTKECEILMQSVESKTQSSDISMKKNEELQEIINHQKLHIDVMEHKKHEAALHLEEYLKEIGHLKHEYEILSHKELKGRRELNESNEMVTELETRLEQVLVRWQQEKDVTLKETNRCKFLHNQNDQLKSTIDEKQREIETLSFKLKQYDDLPIPEEIKIRFQDLENDIVAYKLQKESQEEIINHQKDMINNLQEEETKRKTELEEYSNLLESEKKARLVVEESKKELFQQIEEAGRVIEDMESHRTETDATMGALVTQVATLQEDLKKAEELYEWEKRCRIQESGSNSHGSTSIRDIANQLKSKEPIATETKNGEKNNFEVDTTNIVPILKQGSTDSLENREKYPHGHSLPRVNSVTFADVDAISTDTTKFEDQDTNLNEDSAEVFSNIPTRSGTAQSFYNFRADSAGANATKAKALLANIDKEQEEDAHRDHLAKDRVELTSEAVGAKGLYDIVTTEFMKDNVHVIWRSLRALREFLIKDLNFHEYCCNHRFDTVVVQCMEMYPKSSMLQAQALRVLAAMAYGNDRMRRFMGESGIVSMIIRTMDSYPDDEIVQLHACTTLTNLFHNSLENRSRFIDNEGVDLLLGHMDLYKQSAKFQRQALWALLTLAGTDEASRVVMNKGASSCILNAMVEHGDDVAVQQFACWTLCNLAVAGDDIRRKLKKCGFEELCKMAIEKFHGEGELIRYAKNALGVLNPSYYVSAPHFNNSDSNCAPAGGRVHTSNPMESNSLVTSASSSRLSTSLQEERMVRNINFGETMGSVSTPQSPIPNSKLKSNSRSGSNRNKKNQSFRK